MRVREHVDYSAVLRQASGVKHGHAVGHLLYDSSAPSGANYGMTEPIKSGDRCEVIAGALGNTGPNIGKQVTVGELRGEHSEHGRIWRCHGEGLVTEFGALGTQADFAQSWLRKLPPSEVPPAVQQREEVSSG